MRIVILLGLVLYWGNTSCQIWYSKMYNITGGQEVAKAIALDGDTIFIRSTHVCDTNLCTIIGIYNHNTNEFLQNREYEGIQNGLKNVMLADEGIFIASEERFLKNNITISKFNNKSLDFIAQKNLRIDSSRYFSYIIGPAIRFYDKLIIGANALDSLVFIGYQGWNNYQEKAILFKLDIDLEVDTFLIIPPSSGAFLKIEDMAIGPDSILYISFYEKYLKQGNPNLFLEIRKVIYGYDRNMQKIFEWIGPDFDVPESITRLTVSEDSIIYFNYKHDFRSYIAALNLDGSLKWECSFDSNPGKYLYYIRRLMLDENGDILGTGVISSVFDELGESGFIFRIDPEGHLLWKRALRINKGMDLTLPPEFPFRSNLEDIIELPNGDLFSSGYIRKYVGYDKPGGPYNEDVWIVRTNEAGCISPNCTFIQDIVFKDQYIRLVSPRNEWVVDVDTPSSPTVINRYTFHYDSILIDGRYYYELLYAPTVQSPWQGTGRLMRETDGRVFELDPNGVTETLLYDFNFQTGDTMIMHPDGSVNVRQVIQVGTTKLWDDVIRKTITMTCESNEVGSDTTIWIEGMGDMERLFWSKSYCSAKDVDSVKRTVRCFLVSEQATYSRPGLEDCYITAIDEPKVGMIKVYPNPSNGELHFDLPYDFVIHSITFYNCLSQKVLYADSLGNNKMDVSMLPRGSYFGLLRFRDGTTKLFRCTLL